MPDVGDALAVSVIGALIVAVCFVGAILGTVVGMVVGRVVGMTPLGSMVLAPLEAAGIHGVKMMDLGALMGFIGGFLVSSQKA